MRINSTREQLAVQKEMLNIQDVSPKSSSLEEVRGREEVSLTKESRKTGGQKIELNKLKEIIEALDRFMHTLDIELRFKIHEPTREVIARLINKETGEVIREIPPEKFLDMLAKLQELAGLFVDELR